ncbi:MAG: tRNA N6-adenosine threonylcarbamoyltransferase [Anaerolineales bacterium]|nr:tRNA N6-adenosine threonylcarbamoyltransferase [Anaerolineales bacterium]
MLLAIDTSTAQMGLALYDGASVHAELAWILKARHTVELAPALAGLLARAGQHMRSLTALGIAIGPGSFTSLRVGLAFAKGLALARKLPLIGVPTLDVAAAAVPLQSRPLAVVIQAGRTRVAVGWYQAGEDRWQTRGPARTMTVDELAESIRQPTLVVGELGAEERQRLARKRVNVHLLSPARSIRRPALLAELAWERFQHGRLDETASLAPIYLHTEGGAPI